MTAAYEQIQYAVENGIATITLNRPEKLNAFTGTMMNELIDVFARINKDDAVRCVIVTGSGRAFCAGADLSAGAKTFDYDAREDRPEKQGGGRGASIDWSNPALRDGGGRVTLQIFECLKPVIAAVNGPAVGIGVTMQLPMDIRIASDTARFGFVFARRGIVPEACSSWFLPRLVGIQTAAEWCYSGRVFDAQEALARGLVSRVVKPEALLPRSAPRRERRRPRSRNRTRARRTVRRPRTQADRRKERAPDGCRARFLAPRCVPSSSSRPRPCPTRK